MPLSNSLAMLPPVALEEARRVAASARRDLDLIFDDLRSWVDLDTPGGDSELLDSFARTFGERLQRYGLNVELVPDDAGLYVHATLEGNGSAHVCLLGHHDTVFPAGTASARPFRLDGDRCYGPGVADMKGGLAVAAHAARLMVEGSRPFRRLELVSVPDEEARDGGPATGKRLLACDAVLCLECGRSGGEIVSARKGARWFRIHAQGRPAHAGEAPDEGRNAAHALAEEVVRLARLHEARPGVTLQVTELEAGEGLNTVPSNGSLTADLRAWTQEDLDWALEQALTFAGYEGIELRHEDLGGPPPFERTPVVARLAETAIALGQALGHRFGETGAGGVSDGSWTASQGVPTLDGLGPVGGEDHTPFEYAEVASIAPRIGVVAGLVGAIDAGLLSNYPLRRKSNA